MLMATVVSCENIASDIFTNSVVDILNQVI